VGEAGRLPVEASEHIVIQRRSVPPEGIAVLREASRPLVHRDAELGRGGKGVALDVFDVQNVGPKGPTARQGLVCGVASVVDGAQIGAQFFQCLHGDPPLHAMMRLFYLII